jgi:hypothetical protein
MSNTLRRVYIALCIVVGVITMVANAATTDAMAAKWARVAMVAIFLFSMSTARQLWQGLSASEDEPPPHDEVLHSVPGLLAHIVFQRKHMDWARSPKRILNFMFSSCAAMSSRSSVNWAQADGLLEVSPTPFCASANGAVRNLVGN